jgi:hypothetical protein
MDHLAQATTDHNMQYVIKSTRRADSTHSNLTATAKLPPLNGHADDDGWPGSGTVASHHVSSLVRA